MTTRSKSIVGVVTAVPVIAGIAYFILAAVFETRLGHSQDVQAMRVERRQAIEQQEQAHELEYQRVLCELEAIRQADNRVCR